jgi:hypothetical protein
LDFDRVAASTGWLHQAFFGIAKEFSEIAIAENIALETNDDRALKREIEELLYHE